MGSRISSSTWVFQGKPREPGRRKRSARQGGFDRRKSGRFYRQKSAFLFQREGSGRASAHRISDVLSDLVLNPVFAAEDIVRERRVILEEDQDG